jgi:hypothetical protein
MAEQLVLVTSVVRQAGRADASGLVRVIELESGRVVARAMMRESEFRDKDSNPRGGVRGARGATVYGDRVVIANSERLIILDASWNHVREITHPMFGGIHDVLADNQGIWVTSTAADLLVGVDWQGKVREVWDWRADRQLLRRLGHVWLPRGFGAVDHRDPELTRDLVTNAAHLNAVAACPGGLLVSLGRVLSPMMYARRRLRGVKNHWFKTKASSHHDVDGAKKTKVVGAPIPGSRAAIVRLVNGTAELVLDRFPTTVPNHNIHQLADWVVFNDTNQEATTAVSLTDHRTVASVAIPGAPAFARGLAHVRDRRFLVGSQEPAALYEVDLDGQSIVRTYDIGGMPNECVYGIVLLPSTFKAPGELRI